MLSLGVGIEQGWWKGLFPSWIIILESGLCWVFHRLATTSSSRLKIHGTSYGCREDHLECAMPAVCSGSSLLILVLFSFLFSLSQHLNSCWRRKICSVLMPLSHFWFIFLPWWDMWKSLSDWKNGILKFQLFLSEKFFFFFCFQPEGRWCRCGGKNLESGGLTDSTDFTGKIKGSGLYYEHMNKCFIKSILAPTVHIII